MVSFRNMGRMGNFFFQAATAFSYAKKHGLDFTVPSKTHNKVWDPIYLQHLVKPMPTKPLIVIKEKGHQYQELPFDEAWRNKNILLEGYWQSPKYFDWCREELLKAFAIPWHPHNDISIHVRRGDYLQYPDKHPVVPREYYVEALKIFYLLGYKDAYVFSDDIPWCKEFFPTLDSGYTFYYSEGKSEMEDLVGISSCAHHISSSSTFGWWGAWLNQNPNKKVITPKLWFMPNHNNLITDDIIPESWIKI